MNKSLLHKFGRRVRKHREEQKLSQEEFAYKANFHRTYIGMVERGEKNITLLGIEKIASALEIPMSSLLIDLEDENDD